ncbi:MAG: DNA helicase, partial [Rhodobacteraceae bacterium]|nr:DNA helicase [Paracoccaceae bacterium]
MQLAAPIYALKRKAKLLARRQNVPLHAAQDMVAAEEGFQRWSHLINATSAQSPAGALLTRLRAGELILIGARPGQGKTLLGLELAARASEIGRRGYVFSLDYHASEIAGHVQGLGAELANGAEDLVVDTSDDLCVDYIINHVGTNGAHTLITVDYLQLLDQKRSTLMLDESLKKNLSPGGGDYINVMGKSRHVCGYLK